MLDLFLALALAPLVEQLGHDKFVVREAASALLGLQPWALDGLALYVRHPDPEVAHRVEAILRAGDHDGRLRVGTRYRVHLVDHPGYDRVGRLLQVGPAHLVVEFNPGDHSVVWRRDVRLERMPK